MALQTSGQISMSDVYTELTGSAPAANANYTLKELCDGSIAPLNTASPNLPTTTAPYRLKSWYGYDHSYSASATTILQLDAYNASSYPGSGSAWTDLSASSNDITLYGTYSFTSSNPKYVNLTAANAYAEVASTTAAFEFQGNEAFAAFALFKVPASTDTRGALLGNMLAVSPYVGWNIYLHTGTFDKIRIQLIDTWTSDAIQVSYDFDYDANAGDNMLIGFVYDGSTPTTAAAAAAAVDLYVDGALYTTGKTGSYGLANSGISYNASQEFRLSSRWASGAANSGAPVSINYARVYDGEPASGDISALWTSLSQDGRFNPTASFTISDTTPDITQNVVFTSTSSSPKGAITAYSWSISGVQNTDWTLQAGSLTGSTCTIRFLYASANYTVNLTTTNAYGNEATAFANNITTNAAGAAPTASFTLVFNGTLGRTDKVITLTDISSGGTDRGWEITGGSYTIIDSGNLGTYATGQGGSGIIKVTFDDPDQTYTVNIRSYNTNGTDTATDTQFITAYLLEEYSTSVKQVFSLRKLNADITNAIRVRRDSNGDEQDIGFDNNGNLDTAAIQTFVGASNNGYIVTWYDQSGNGWNVTQSATVNQPRIIASNVIDVDSSGNVAARFLSASNTRMKGTTTATTMGLNGSQNRTDYLVACEITQSYLGTTISIAGTVPTAYANGALWRITHEAGNRVYGGNRRWENSNTNFASSDVQLGVVKLNGTSTSNMTHYQNGSNTASNVTATGVRTLNIGAAYTFFGNDYLGSSYLNGYVAEYIVYATAHDDTTRGLIEDDILAYYAGI